MGSRAVPRVCRTAVRWVRAAAVAAPLLLAGGQTGGAATDAVVAGPPDAPPRPAAPMPMAPPIVPGLAALVGPGRRRTPVDGCGTPRTSDAGDSDDGGAGAIRPHGA